MQQISYNTYCLKRQQLMANQELPSEFEVIVIGTGLEESIVAAAAARNGHTVLHVDTKPYYGDDWASFNFDGLQEWIASASKTNEEKDDKDFSGVLKEGEKVYSTPNESSVTVLGQEWFVPEAEKSPEETPEAPEESLGRKELSENQAVTESDTQGTISQSEGDNVTKESSDAASVESNNQSGSESIEKGEQSNTEPSPAKEEEKPAAEHHNTWTQTRVRESSRRFNLDLMPRLLFSRGAMVELLISSNISRYTEFKSVSRVLTLLNGSLEHVPSSRADVFTTKHISVVEKRILMKYLTFCLDFEEHPETYETFKDRSYLDFLKHERLTENLIHFVMHSIAMVTKDTKCEDGLRATKKFLSSLGRFGNTPFLWSMYGSGEMPQAFCRLCAVFGGTYFLGKSVDGIIVDKDDRPLGIITDGQRIDCKYLVTNGNACPTELKKVSGETVISRKICLTSSSILPSEKEQLSFVALPPKEDSQNFRYIQEVGFGAAACPRGMYCLHLTADGADSLDGCLESVLEDRTKLVWTTDFVVRSKTFVRENESRLFICSGPAMELDYDVCIKNARDIYNAMFEGEEFLPRAPDPEEIIIGGEEEKEKNDKEENQEESNKEGNEEESNKEVHKEESNEEVNKENTQEAAVEECDSEGKNISNDGQAAKQTDEDGSDIKSSETECAEK